MTTSSFVAGAYSAAQNLGAKTLAAKPGLGAGALGGQLPDFSSLVRQAVDGVGSAGVKADQQVSAAVAGQADLVNVVTAVAESEAAIETLVAVRDRVIAAYEEIMRMQV
ncbi:MAG: flagellar hook-basal body complex protein FliE [Hyphomicrobiales bacterium]|jgi:flagellar hook-basal body complex protein FliE|nr:flagellar hook-basal body complex protein FliE [Hyphomicrobiales bacterium]